LENGFEKAWGQGDQLGNYGKIPVHDEIWPGAADFRMERKGRI
jgi:hypothetical protein